MKYEAKMEVEKKVADQLELFCIIPPGDCGRGEVLFDRETQFPNGCRVVVQVIASENPDTESCWTQSVLFDADGNELSMTPVGDTFIGKYYIYNNEDEYIVEVVGK